MAVEKVEMAEDSAPEDAREPAWLRADPSIESLTDVLGYIQEEVFNRTVGRAAQCAVSELHARAAEAGQHSHALDKLDDLCFSQMIERGWQAVALGYALALTRDSALAGNEAWCRAAMARLGLAPISREEYRALQERIDVAEETRARFVGGMIKGRRSRRKGAPEYWY